MKNDRSIPAEIVMLLTSLATLILCLAPFLYIAALSLSSPAEILRGRVLFLPRGITTEAYARIFAYPGFLRAYGNTLIYAVFGTAISLFLSLLAAYPLAHADLPYRGVFMRGVLITMFFSGGLIPSYLLISALRLTGTRFALLLPFAVNPFNLILLISFLSGIPRELEEAARIDGLGYPGTLARIFLPLSLPGLSTVGLYTAVFFWNDWFYSLIYLSAPQYPVTLLLRNIVNGASAVGGAGGVGDNASVAVAVKGAAILCSTLPMLLLYPFLQRYFVKGATLGAVKG